MGCALARCALVEGAPPPAAHAMAAIPVHAIAISLAYRAREVLM
jgi:hypothetical protein